MSEIVFVVAAVVVMAGCGSGTLERGQSGAHESTSEFKNVIPATAAVILEQADHFELLSLDPRPQRKAAKSDFRGYRVLGTVVLAEAETRKKLVSAFKRAVTENQGIMAVCFNPRHGIRVTLNDKQADFVICFQCAQVHVYGEFEGEFLITNSAQALFDSVLQSNGIPLAHR